MNKDTVVASVIGFGLGLIAAIALWVVPRVFPPKGNPTTSPSPTTDAVALASNTPQSNITLKITKPVDGDIVTGNSVSVEGTGPNDGLIVISTASGSATVNAKADGSFTSSVDLIDGGNEIVISAVGNGSKSQSVTVYHYSDDL